MMKHKELIAKMWSQSKYKEKYDEVVPEFEMLRKILEARKTGWTAVLLITNSEEKGTSYGQGLCEGGH